MNGKGPHSNGNGSHSNGHSNGRYNGNSNGHGRTNGHTNGHSNGHANGRANGHTNGRADSSRIHPELEPYFTVPLPKAQRRSPPWIALGTLCFVSLAGLTAAIFTFYPRLFPAQTGSPKSEDFRWAVNRAMSAAELTQTADSDEEWLTITTWWREAIDLMQNVPASSPNYSVAQSKVVEYERNLAYARSKLSVQASIPTPSANLWAVGSKREDVLRIQGDPNRVSQYNSLCREVLYYGASTVELNNGTVNSYEDADKNLRVSASESSTIPSASPDSAWTLGSNREQVFRVQGTPDQIVRPDSVGEELLMGEELFYYGDSIVAVSSGRVTGYRNIDGNLKVSVRPVSTNGLQINGNYWTLGSERNAIFKVQGTPTQVIRNAALCTETFYYGNSTIELKNGSVTGYDNFDGNLRVRVD
ncbi:hypothetical protein IQ268_15135 [Oculatella sp. LEGE 06141]|uniref:hypothetical protein n=1 Tax=Oculatella sp. LEGE 06141 TaxID=1828648 RepID=UPI00187F3146|nr:hypothetical protein [Oculatella sp. LEGE 06141]MBE9179904.1 hypothetical protein [Oculatella sp. LEGE 06141]